MLNKRLLTVEDVNSVIKHFSKGFVDYYILDTKDLTTPDTWFAYDFIDVYRVTGSISFKVKNSLWTGGFRVLDSNVSSPTVSVSSGTITVSKTGLEWVVLELELSPEFSNESIFELDYEVEYTPCIRPFYEEDVYLTMGFLDGETPVTGMSVDDLITGETLTTDSDGLVTVTLSRQSKGDYDYVLECSNNGVTVDYKFPYQRIQAELPVILLNEHIYRDKTNALLFKFLFDDYYDLTHSHLFYDNNIVLKVNGKVYELNENLFDVSDFAVFGFDVPIGLETFVDLKLEIGGNDYIDNYTVEIPVQTSFVTLTTGTDLKNEVEGENGAKTILFNGSELDSSILVSDDVVIRFGDVVSSSLDSVFSVSNGAVLTLENIGFTGKQLVVLDNGVCSIVNGAFQHSTATIVKGTGDLTVMDTSFVDNTSCIDVIGNVSLSNVLFDLSDTDYLDTSTPAFVKCSSGLSVDYCQFHLDLHGLTSLGLSYVMCYLGKDGTVNDINNINLLGNDTFPVKHNTGAVNVTSTNYRFTSIGNKCMVWTIEDTNTVYSNNLNIEYIGGE